jgi:hypothetical protein
MEKKIIAAALIISIINIFVSITTNDNSKSLISQIEKHSVHPLHGTYEQKTFGCQPWDACHH